jgi:7-carboxy-7-deazaguanine synthase
MTGQALHVSEIFGPTWQGEGPSTGQTATFLRLAHCNLACGKDGAKFACDSKFTWDRPVFQRMTREEIFAELKAIPASRVVITGGEPLLHQDRLTWIVDMCRAIGRPVEIETNATIAPTRAMLAAVRQWNVSPKLSNSGMPHHRRIKPAVLEAFTRARAVFKFVVTDVTDLDEIAELESVYGLAPIWVMPEGTTAEAVLSGMRELADDVLKHGWNLTPRLHVLLWGDQRGR